MVSQPTVSRVHLTRAQSRDRRSGLLGFLAFVLDDTIQVDGVGLRLSGKGEPILTWPGRRDGSGLLRHSVRPLTDEARRSIERQVLAALAPDLARRDS